MFGVGCHSSVFVVLPPSSSCNPGTNWSLAACGRNRTCEAGNLLVYCKSALNLRWNAFGVVRCGLIQNRNRGIGIVH